MTHNLRDDVGDVCDRRQWRRQGSNKEWQQHGDWQVPLVGTQTEPMLQQDASALAMTRSAPTAVIEGRSFAALRMTQALECPYGGD